MPGETRREKPPWFESGTSIPAAEWGDGARGAGAVPAGWTAAVALRNRRDGGGEQRRRGALSLGTWSPADPTPQPWKLSGSPGTEATTASPTGAPAALPSHPWQPHLGVDVEGQDEEGEQQVGDGEADDEVVGGGLQRPLRADAETHQPVAAHDEQDEDDAQHQGGDVVAARRRRWRRWRR